MGQEGKDRNRHRKKEKRRTNDKDKKQASGRKEQIRGYCMEHRANNIRGIKSNKKET